MYALGVGARLGSRGLYWERERERERERMTGVTYVCADHGGREAAAVDLEGLEHDALGVATGGEGRRRV